MEPERFGVFDFGLTEEQEARARRLHRESIIIDSLFQGPCGHRSFSEETVQRLQREFERYHDSLASLEMAVQMQEELAIRNELPDFKPCWDESGITAGNRQQGFALSQAQFDRLPWLIKATTADDIRRAKAQGLHAGFLNVQFVDDIGLNLDRLDEYHRLGLRMVQLTYNSVNYVGGGCTDRTDCGVTNYGVTFIGRLNALGIIVDVAHCGRQTTLDACALSSFPVVASHTSAAAVYPHDRAKSDAEIRAIAATGGYIGVYCVPAFLTDAAEATIEHVLDHVDYVARLVGPLHVGIGSDWPLSMPVWSRQRFAEWALEHGGFRPEHGVTAAEHLGNLRGFDDYRDFPNITRGLVARGYTDEEIGAILGGNFLRVFEQVCG